MTYTEKVNKIELILKGTAAFAFLFYLLDNILWYFVISVAPPVNFQIGAAVLGAILGLWISLKAK